MWNYINQSCCKGLTLITRCSSERDNVDGECNIKPYSEIKLVHRIYIYS